jgi:hypothetical protein
MDGCVKYCKGDDMETASSGAKAMAYIDLGSSGNFYRNTEIGRAHV